MTSTRPVLLLSQEERPAAARTSPLATSTAGGRHDLTRLESSGLALPPSGDEAFRPGALASLSLGVDNAR